MIPLPFQDRQSRDHRIQAGIDAERQLAHYLDRVFGADPRVDLYYGLRLPIDRTSTAARQDAVQMDVLLVHNHGMAIIESKSVHAQVRVTSRNEWSRTYRGESLGMQSPIEQARRQAEALRELLDKNKQALRDRKALGLLQGGFKHCPIECFVAISDKGIIVREKSDLAPEVMKADQIADRVKKRVDQHQKFGGFVGLLRATVAKGETDDGDWSMTEEERGRVREWLMGLRRNEVVKTHGPL